MNEENKFCPNCGGEVAIEEKFCSSCGFNFETREVSESEEQNGLSNEQGKFDFKNIDFKSIDFKNLNKKQLGIIGGAIVGLLLLVFLFTGNISIAGTYESEETLSDSRIRTYIEISRDGKAQYVTEHYNSDDTTVYTVYLEETGENIYTADTSKGMGIEVTSDSDWGSYGNLLGQLPHSLSTTDFEFDNSGDIASLQGSLTEIEAIDVGMDLRDIYIVELNETLMFNDTRFIER